MGRNSLQNRIDPFGLSGLFSPPQPEHDWGDFGELCLDNRDFITDHIRDTILGRPLDQVNDEANRFLDKVENFFEDCGKKLFDKIQLGLSSDPKPENLLGGGGGAKGRKGKFKIGVSPDEVALKYRYRNLEAKLGIGFQTEDYVKFEKFNKCTINVSIQF